jgi:hypothetical protein
MIAVNPTQDQLNRAAGFYEFDALNNSIMEGKSNIFGALGEVLFGDLYPEWRKVESYDFDFVGPNDRTVDIKTKRTTAVPQPDWNCSVAATSGHQQPDYFFFIRVTEDYERAWLLGWLSRDEFYDLAHFGKRGEPDPSKPGWVYRADCWNVAVRDLRPPSESKATGAYRCHKCGMLTGGPMSDPKLWCGCPF